MKIIDSSYDKNSGISLVLVKDKQNLIVQAVELDEEDKDIASNYAGCYFAEIKATIKILKNKYKEEQLKLKHMLELYNQLPALRDFEEEKNTRMYKYLKKQVAIQRDKTLTAYIAYKELKDEYPKIIDERLKMARSIPKEVKKLQDRYKVLIDS